MEDALLVSLFLFFVYFLDEGREGGKCERERERGR